MSGSWSEGAACAGACGRLLVEKESKCEAVKALGPFLAPLYEKPHLMHINPWLVINRISLRVLLAVREPAHGETVDDYRGSFYGMVHSALTGSGEELVAGRRVLEAAFGRPMVERMVRWEASVMACNGFYRPLSCSDDFGG